MNMINLLLAQVSSPANLSTLTFLSGPQFFIALIAGVVMAFAFQFVLTNFSIAAGISGGINPADTDADGWGKKLRRIEAKVGSTTIFIVNVALFMACFLAVKLTVIQETGLGAIVAVVIWSVYFLLLLWSSSQAIGSLLGAAGNTAGAVSNTAGSGLQGVMAIAATALGGGAASRQISNTVEASVGAVSKEVQSALSSDRLRENLENYVSTLKLPKPQAQNVPNQALELLSNANLLPGNSSELFDLIKSATPEDLESGKLRERLTKLLGLQTGGDGQSQGEEGRGEPQKQGVSLRERTLQLGTNALLSTLVGRSGLSGLDLERLSNIDLENLTQSLGSLGDKLSHQIPLGGNQGSASVIRSDVEHYLLNSPAWYLRPDSLDHGFREVLFDPDADAGQVLQQVEQLHRPDFVAILQRREGMNPDQVNDIADQLELIRREVLDTVRTAAEQARSQALRHQVETYFRSAPKEALNPDAIEQEFTALLADPEATYETLGNRLLQFDRDALMQMLLASRQDLNPEETEEILNALEGARDRFLNQSQETWNQLQAQASEFRQQVESYLRETNLTDLTPDAIRQTFQRFLESPSDSFAALRNRLNQLDRNTLEQILTQRQDLNPEQVNQLIDQIETVQHGLLHAPQALTEQAQEQVDRLTHKIADYLRNTNLDELNPEGIQQELRQVLDDPQAGLSALGSRLQQIDRQTLVQLVSQQSNWSESQINRAIDQTLDALQTIAQTPREFVVRTRDRLQDLPSQLADYLKHTDREELNPEGIQRDLRLLLQQPRTGVKQLGERLSQVDRETFVSLLSQREDISEEDANRIADQITSVRDQVVQQVQNVQEQVQAVVNKASDQTRDYLNSLERPELNYESIQRDIRKLFDDPEAGLEALRDRLSQFDRDTLVAILSSRSDISEEQANKIIDQIEAARDNVLHRAETLQTKVEERIKALKHQAKEQAEELQKTVASAAWWLFGTAITSVATAAIAGVLAANGFHVLD